jgi:hypothetical protein
MYLPFGLVDESRAGIGDGYGRGDPSECGVEKRNQARPSANIISQWLYAGMKKAGLAVELLETGHIRDAFGAMPVKTDRQDAGDIAALMRLGWFRPVRSRLPLPAR